MKPTAIDLYTDIYSGLLDARFSDYHEGRHATAQEALDVAYRRLSALEGMILLVNPTEEISAEPYETKEVSQ